ncbi:hypothetical protein C8R44DRAFT_974191 [Mycena epipterygia]|nr:hypothetical protein C8R44DRAFT_974191 [Mycena epipterygia]
MHNAISPGESHRLPAIRDIKSAPVPAPVEYTPTVYLTTTTCSPSRPSGRQPIVPPASIEVPACKSFNPSCACSGTLVGPKKPPRASTLRAHAPTPSKPARRPFRASVGSASSKR